MTYGLSRNPKLLYVDQVKELGIKGIPLMTIVHSFCNIFEVSVYLTVYRLEIEFLRESLETRSIPTDLRFSQAAVLLLN
jgi:hypothetical protein